MLAGWIKISMLFNEQGDDMKQPIGAFVTMKYCDSTDPAEHYDVYMSVVDYADDADWESDDLEDLAGVPDRLIYFCTNNGGEESLKQLLDPNNGEDFYITDYSLVFDRSEVL